MKDETFMRLWRIAGTIGTIIILGYFLGDFADKKIVKLVQKHTKESNSSRRAGNLEKAIESNKRSLKLIENQQKFLFYLHDDLRPIYDMQTALHHDIGVFYALLHNRKQALAHLETALDIRLNKLDGYETVSKVGEIYLLLGNIHQEMGDLKKTYENYQLAADHGNLEAKSRMDVSIYVEQDSEPTDDE